MILVRNTNNLVQDLNSVRRYHFFWRKTLHGRVTFVIIQNYSVKREFRRQSLNVYFHSSSRWISICRILVHVVNLKKQKKKKKSVSLVSMHTSDHHHHHVVPLARISLILSHHFSLSFIASGRSSGLHPVSSHSCCMYVRAGRPAFAWPYAGVHKSASLMSSPLLLQQCPACLVRLAWIVFVMRSRWPYSWCLVGCCCQDLFNIARNILV